MPIVSVTRLRLRSVRFLPLFYIHAHRIIAQIRKAEGQLAGAVKREGDLAYWTVTIWRDEIAMQAFAASGAHRSAMPHLQDWCSEAGMVRWVQQGADLPDWAEAARRLREEGRASNLRYPGPDHAGLTYPAPSEGYDMRF